MTMTTYLAHDEVVAVSEYTRDEIIASAEAGRPALRHPVRPSSAASG